MFARWGTLLRVLVCVIAWRQAVAAQAGATQPPAATGGPYQLVKKVVLGGEGFWDYLKIDSVNRRVYITRGTHVMVLDADTYQPVGDIPNTQGVHGVALCLEYNRGFTSDGGASTVTIFNLKTLKTIGEAPTGAGPDAIIYDGATRRVFTMNGRGDSTTAIDAKTGKPVGTAPLGGRPEFAASDGEGHVYVNLEDKSMVDEVDSRRLKVLARWPLAPGESPSGMAIDRQHRRLFIGCHNQLMVVMNADNGKVVATLPIGRGVDANRFDPGTGYAFSSNGDGTLTVVKRDSADKYSVVQTVTTQRGARTMAVDRKTQRVLLVTAQFGPPPPPKPGQRFRRPTMVPGSFTLLVYGLSQ